LSRHSDAEDMVVCFIGDHPLTAKDLGEEILNEDIRTVFQTIIDKGLVPGIEPGSPWYEHLRMGGMEAWNTNRQVGDSELIGKLIENRRTAERELLETYTPEARDKVVEAQRRVRMARKLSSD
jgi:hypothetical protein